ncbi:hypothetical protein FOA43_001253 [Brettanomyces nanus]|uniref:Protein YIF1 n=1 Tax=Eeniella nana TaxID=13502 RepID=A0A875RYZ1_EENNA|nr:uncharacterized protein FOA43_001253 [Brettanomyces nanus]QPG73938.1 hypothetical protein FOA43_001253 [Brettanomyces nanus]
MYNPYAQPEQNAGSLDPNGVYPTPFVSSKQPFLSQSRQQQQQQHQQQQQQQHGVGRAGTGTPTQLNFNNIMNDSTAQMGLHFGQTAFNASQQYMQQNLKLLVSDENIKYYFKVSNSYVLQKLLLILVPYRNKTWIRQFRSTTDAQGNAVEIYATPRDDINAPDLYIPSMALVTYILLWAVFSGFHGDFHPQLLGYALTRTLAFYLMDVLLLKLSFYTLAINSKNSKIWDLVSYSGYKFVTTLLLMIFKNTVNSYLIVIVFFLVLVFSLGFFLMRSLRYVVLPGGLESGTVSAASKRLRTQFLFIYSFVLQAVMVWLMA